MKRQISILTLLMAFSLISCDEVMDLTQPEKAEVTYSNITLSLYQTGKYDLYLDEPEYQYNIIVEKSHCEKEAKAELAVVDAKEFGEEYSLLPVGYYDLDGDKLEFKGDDVLHTVNLRFHDLATLDGSKKYVLGLKLVSDDLAVNEEKSAMTFYLQQKQGGIGNPYIITAAKDLTKLGEYLKDGQTTYVRLGADIDLQGTDWTPVETTAARPVDFDGCGHTIRNLKVVASSSAYQGFFGLLIGKCSNVIFENAQITADKKLTGILAGQVGNTSAAGQVEHVRVSGTINLNSGNLIGADGAWDVGQAGGICGRLQGAASGIRQCSAEANVTASWFAGGICGEMSENATVKECYYNGTVESRSCVAGIAARVLSGTIQHCHSHGVLTAYYPVVANDPTKGLIANPGSGIAGLVDATPADVMAVYITHCWSDCTIAAQNQVGGIMGFAVKDNNTGITLTHCIAWNPSLYSNGAPRSGKVSGFFKKNIADKCYAYPQMNCRFSATTPALNDDAGLNGSTNADRYNGLSTESDLIKIARDILQWDTSIWNFDGAEPRLAWELTK
jgi:hypothetical protein